MQNFRISCQNGIKNASSRVYIVVMGKFKTKGAAESRKLGATF